MSWLGNILKIGGIAGAPFTGGASLALTGAAQALGGISNAKAKNRGEKLGAQMDLEGLLMARERNYQNMRIDREQEGRAGGLDAWQRLLMAQRTANPGPQPMLSRYSVAPRQASESELTGADAMTREVMARLQGGNPIPGVTERPLEVDRRLMNPSRGENVLGWLGAILGGVGSASERRGAPQ